MGSFKIFIKIISYQYVCYLVISEFTEHQIQYQYTMIRLHHLTKLSLFECYQLWRIFIIKYWLFLPNIKGILTIKMLLLSAILLRIYSLTITISPQIFLFAWGILSSFPLHSSLQVSFLHYLGYYIFLWSFSIQGISGIQYTTVSY